MIGDRKPEVGMVGPGGTQWRGPAVAAGAGATVSVPASAHAGFEITTLVKSGTEHVGPGEWTYNADLKVRHRNERGAGESTKTLTMTASWRAAGYALGRLLVASGQGAGYLKGDIAEIVVCLGVVEEGRRQAVEDYLARRYFAKERSNFRYTGNYYHTKSGLHLAPYRAYDAKHGVWLSEDPIQEEGGINLYGYVGNSPLMAVDPLGLDRFICQYGGMHAGLKYPDGAGGWLTADFSIIGLKIFPTTDPSSDPEAKRIPSTSAEDKVLRDTMESIRTGKKFNPLYDPSSWNCRHFTNRHKYDGMTGKPMFRIESIIPIYPPVRP